MNEDLSKSRIININDFIFRQNLEFYPNLLGLNCIDNNLIYEVDGKVLANETLTFDLRTLPGDAWNTTPEEFMNIIRLNKDCRSLSDFLELIEKHAYDPFIKPEYHESEAA